MRKLLLLLILQYYYTPEVHSQSFTVDELVTLAYMPSKNIDRFMNKNGFVLSGSKLDSLSTGASFIGKIKSSKNAVDPKRTVDIFVKDDSKYFTLRTPVMNEYLEGQQSLIKAGFFYDTHKDPVKESSMLYQKGNISIQATTQMQDGLMQYTFNLKEKANPSAVTYAEDLLQFDSHEFLSSFFGEQNVNRDMYFLSETELKKCSVLYSGTQRQAVFVWGDENHLNNLSYILITNILPTANAKKNTPLIGNNEWQFKSGIHAGMALKDLLKINEMDFDIYGNKSDLAFMVSPDEGGRIDFKKTAVMLTCNDCYDDKIFSQKVVSALAVAKANLPMRIYDVILYPSSH